MSKITQEQLVVMWIKEFGSMTPAKIGGHVYRGIMFGSETSKRARDLRAKGILRSEQVGKFERYFLNEHPKVFTPQPLL